MHKHPAVSNDIVVLAIEDASLEALWDKYGEWPIPRSVYADVINHIEKQNPKAIILDLLFIKSIRSSEDADKKLVDTMKNYNNIYTGLNFDAQPEDVRKPIDLPEHLKLNVQNDSKIDFSNYTFLNCRGILQDILNSDIKVGITSIIRNEDGIIRKVAPLMVYKNDFYPYLAFSSGNNTIAGKDITEYKIDKDYNLQYANGAIPLTKDGDTILNWYGPSKTHTIYPLYRVINDIESNANRFDFKDKIILLGTTATSLHDTKSVPVQEGVYPGVEIHATFLNNMLDNNFIVKTSLLTDLLIIIGVIAFVGIIVMLSTSTMFAILSTILFSIGYLFVTYYLMCLCNLWVPVIIPVIAIIIAFALSFLAKYLMKSRDFDYQYKLATIDGLTELYNHRYFQDTLRKQIELSSRYQQRFSLIMIDIDFFKSFNDKYGHQAGDAVLRQVAEVLKRNSRATDVVCRYGGEEMCIILPNTNTEEAMNNANRIRTAIAEKPFKLNANDTANVTISAGVSTYPDDAQTAQEIIEIADKGLYISKTTGRNKTSRITKEA